jgi:hypothetical protein
LGSVAGAGVEAEELPNANAGLAASAGLA